MTWILRAYSASRSFVRRPALQYFSYTCAMITNRRPCPTPIDPTSLLLLLHRPAVVIIHEDGSSCGSVPPSSSSSPVPVLVLALVQVLLKFQFHRNHRKQLRPRMAFRLLPEACSTAQGVNLYRQLKAREYPQTGPGQLIQNSVQMYPKASESLYTEAYPMSLYSLSAPQSCNAVTQSRNDALLVASSTSHAAICIRSARLSSPWSHVALRRSKRRFDRRWRP